jgi:hypothetical protein
MGKKIVKSCLLVLLGVFLACIVAEIFIRVGTANQDNYIVEMWRYAKLLKRKSLNENIGHEHIPNCQATLEHVNIAINSYGLRGPEPNLKANYRIAILGDSIALGWGVKEEDSLRGQLASRLPESVDVINLGVGNSNLDQTVSHWNELSKKLPANMLIVLVCPRAPSLIKDTNTSWLVEHSQLAAILSTFIMQISSGKFGKEQLIDGYSQQWTSSQGKEIFEHALAKLKAYQQQAHCKIVLVPIPEMHDINNYQFGFMEKQTELMAKTNGFDFIGTLSSLKGPATKSFWVSEQDIHPNGQFFTIITNQIYPYLNNAIGTFNQ